MESHSDDFSMTTTQYFPSQGSAEEKVDSSSTPYNPINSLQDNRLDKKPTMRVTSILLLSLLGVVSAYDDRGLAALSGIFGGSNGDAEVQTIERVFSEEVLAGRTSGDGVIDADCGLCSPDDLDNIDCKNWDITLSYENVRDRALFCGCADRIDGFSQCAGFSPDSPQLIEDFAVKKCNVHLLCTLGLFDDEPTSHVCAENCWFPIGRWGIGCFSECDTKCFFEITCKPLIQTD